MATGLAEHMCVHLQKFPTGHTWEVTFRVVAQVVLLENKLCLEMVLAVGSPQKVRCDVALWRSGIAHFSFVEELTNVLLVSVGVHKGGFVEMRASNEGLLHGCGWHLELRKRLLGERRLILARTLQLRTR